MTNVTAQRLAYLRAQQGLTQTEFAKKLGIKSQQLNAWENGRRSVGRVSLVKLAAALDTTTDYLTGLTDEASAAVDTDLFTAQERTLIWLARNGLTARLLRILADVLESGEAGQGA
ncbi:MAG TPA: helix-turn-helix transcriptional regulator [Verrucomicrobiae bacterium]|nr:helix-turn-helix transcriptional regulator [Verrucomicrobiae bacterium]